MKYIINKKNIRNLILSEKLRFSVKSIPTGKHYTYSITKPEKADAWFVWCRYHQKWVYLCHFKEDFEVHCSAKSALPQDAEQMRVIRFVMDNLDNLPDNLEFYHTGYCLVCGQRLTTPESIRLGMGPSCYKKLQARHANIHLESTGLQNNTFHSGRTA